MSDERREWSDRCLVSASWLEQHLDEVALVDVRWSIENGPHHREFLDKHIAGAVFADLDVDLSSPPGRRGRHPLPTPEDFAAARTRLGLTGSKPVVAYDDRSGAVAARLWWMLDSLGLDCAVLDGGITEWDGPVESGPAHVESVEQVRPLSWPNTRFIEAGEIEQSLSDGAAVMDARSAERFRGQPNPIDTRPGHIPGATSHPWTDNLTSDSLMRSGEELKKDWDELGITQQRDLIASCGSGVTACHNLLASRLAGGPIGRLYVGSWSEWSGDMSRPVETDVEV